jgi:hypothetical protein
MADKGLPEQQAQVRIPLYETNRQRISDPRSSLVYQYDQSYFNCFPTFRNNHITGEKEAFIQMRPGHFNYDNSTPTSPTLITNNFNYTLDAITITQLSEIYVTAVWSYADGKIYLIARNATGSTVTNLGSITTTTVYPIIHISEITIAGQAGIFITFVEGYTNTTSGWYAIATAGVFTAASLTQVTDLDFPPNQTPAVPINGPAVQLNNKIYVLSRSGYIYNSDSGSASAWDGLSVKNAVSYPDVGIALARYKHHLVVFGSDSIEFFNDVGNATGSPLDRTDQAFIKFVLKGSKAFINIHDTIYWISNSTGASSQLYKLVGYTPQKIDSGQYSYIFGRTQSWMSSMTFFGKTMVCIGSVATPFMSNSTMHSSANSATCLMYNIDDDEFWYYGNTSDTGAQYSYPSYAPPLLCVQSSSDSSNTDVQYLISNLYDPNSSTRYGWAFLKSSTTDQVQAPDSEYQDITGAIVNETLQAQINLNPIEFGNYNRKFLRRLNVILDSLESGTVEVNLYKESWNTNTSAIIHKTKTTVYSADSIDRYSFNNFGSARRFLFSLIIKSGARPTIIRALEAIVAQGTH